MFLVNTVSAIDDDWEERDTQMTHAAGRTSDGNSAEYAKGKVKGERHHVWCVPTVQEARRMVKELNKVTGVTATMREK